jgi:hypothetical protein
MPLNLAGQRETNGDEKALKSREFSKLWTESNPLTVWHNSCFHQRVSSWRPGAVGGEI